MKHIPYIRHKFYDDGMWETRASPKTLYSYYVREKYDVEVAFFRGLAVKTISGSDSSVVKLAWVHSDFMKCEGITSCFRSFEATVNAYRRFDRIVCVSNQARESFIQKTGIDKNIEVIYNLNDIATIKTLAKEPVKRSDLFTVVSVGRFTPVKGFDRLLEAVSTLQNSGINIALSLIGDGSERKALEEYTVNNKINNVTFCGMQLNPYKYIAASDLLICSSRYEGYNLTVAESLILGVPVLSTDCTGPREILDGGKYGYLCENTTEGITNGLKIMIEDKKLYEKYKKAAFERANFFDEEKITDKIESLFLCNRIDGQ